MVEGRSRGERGPWPGRAARQVWAPNTRRWPHLGRCLGGPPRRVRPSGSYGPAGARLVKGPQGPQGRWWPCGLL